MRLPLGDLIIWIRPSRWTSLRGILGRWLEYRGRTRSDMADNCPEKIDLEFLSYIWTFETSVSPRIEHGLSVYGPSVLVLRSHAETARLRSSNDA